MTDLPLVAADRERVVRVYTMGMEKTTVVFVEIPWKFVLGQLDPVVDAVAGHVGGVCCV